MTTLLEPAVIQSGPIVLQGISWDVYESLLAQLERVRQRIYLTYDRGTLEIMPPSPFHEKYKTIIARLIETLSLELNIPIVSLGSTTFKREDLERGLEPDECYYVQHAARMSNRFELDMQVDPPPDLAVEMDYTHHAVDRDAVYGALGVPEIWQYDGNRLIASRRNDSGEYEPTETSVAFPFLLISDIARFVQMSRTAGEHAAVIAFRDWVRQTKGPNA
jgi:Uma2 family endonuclease